MSKASTKRSDSGAIEGASVTSAGPLEISTTAHHHRKRLYQLFGLIEKEFDQLYKENLALQARVDTLTEKMAEAGTLPPPEILDTSDVVAKQTLKKPSQMGQKLKTALRVAPPGRLVNTFKVGGDSARARFVRFFEAHKDGVWHVDAINSTAGIELLGSASADQTAKIWDVGNSRCVVQYLGHQGSVNCIRFNGASCSEGNNLLVATASGDQSAHIWSVGPNLLSQRGQKTPGTAAAKQHSSEDELDASEREEGHEDPSGSQVTCLRQPTLRLTGHNGVVIGVDWLVGGKSEQIITASWDRTANIYDANRGDIISTLSGHDAELTGCNGHLQQKLVVTSSKDTTFRLWDFRDAIQSVAVFQGHSDSVTSATFSTVDKVISGSDDRTVKVWDLRNMRSALSTVRLDSPINRIGVCPTMNMMAIPHDNRHVRLYDLNGGRLARLPRAGRRCHRRMVCAAAWSADPTHAINLFTCGFDRQIIGWKVNSLQQHETN